MLSGTAALAILFALITDALISARLARVLGANIPRGLHDHVVVCGLGNIGYRIVEQLHDLGVPIVAAELHETNRYLPAVRRLGVPVLVADIRLPETLEVLHVGRARSVVVVTSSDIVNLETALNIQALNPDIRVVQRLFDPDLAARVERAFGFRISRSPSALAAPAFAAAAAGEHVGHDRGRGGGPGRGPPPGRAGLPGRGRTVAELEAAAGEPVLLLHLDGGHGPSWHPDGATQLAGGAEFVVVVPRGQLGRILAWTEAGAATATPPPTAEPGVALPPPPAPAPDLDRPGRASASSTASSGTKLAWNSAMKASTSASGTDGLASTPTRPPTGTTAPTLTVTMPWGTRPNRVNRANALRPPLRRTVHHGVRHTRRPDGEEVRSRGRVLGDLGVLDSQEAIEGVVKLPFELGVAHYDLPPPDRLDDLEGLLGSSAIRFANELRAFIEVDDDGRVTGHGHLGRGHMGPACGWPGSASPSAGSASPTCAGPKVGDGVVRFTQTAGGQPGMPSPRRVRRRPYLQVSGPVVWSTLALTIRADGTADFEVVGASSFPRHWIYGHDGTLQPGRPDRLRHLVPGVGRREELIPWGGSASN